MGDLRMGPPLSVGGPPRRASVSMLAQQLGLSKFECGAFVLVCFSLTFAMVGDKVIVSFVVICSSLVGSSGQELNTGQDLFDQYGVVFPNGNRNAASHRWATYIIE